MLFPTTIHMIQNACNLWYKDAHTSCYISHAKCNKCTKESYTYATQGAPTHPTHEIKQTPSSPSKWVKVAWSRGLVKMSASWSCVGTWIKVIFPFSTLSLRKWYFTYMCLVLELCTGFFATLMALVLSHWSGTWVYSSPKSLMVFVIYRRWEQQLVASTFFASVVDLAIRDCLQEDQDTKEEPMNWQVLEVDFLSNRHSAKSTSEKPWRAKEEAQSTKGRSREYCKESDAR
jgi:hypothetical protein